MISEGIIHGAMSALTRLDVATWVDQAMADIKAEHGIVRSAWLQSGYEWFDRNEGVVELVWGGGKGGVYLIIIITI